MPGSGTQSISWQGMTKAFLNSHTKALHRGLLYLPVGMFLGLCSHCLPKPLKKSIGIMQPYK
jgi:hypothetical protein